MFGNLSSTPRTPREAVKLNDPYGAKDSNRKSGKGMYYNTSTPTREAPSEESKIRVTEEVLSVHSDPSSVGSHSEGSVSPKAEHSSECLEAFSIPQHITAVRPQKSEERIASSKQFEASEITDSRKIPLILVPGLQGSELYDASGKKIWVNAKHYLGREHPRLDLPLQWEKVEDDPEDPEGHRIYRQASDGVTAGGLLGRAGRPYYEFPYDWRRDLNEVAHHFAKFLQSVVDDCGVPAQVVGHSLGGLVVYAVMNDPKYVHLFHNAVFAGTPFSQGINFLEFMHVGLPTGLNKDIMDPFVLFTLPSGCVFYPYPDNHHVYGYKDRTPPPKPIEKDERFVTDLSMEEKEERIQFLSDYVWLTTHDTDFYDPEDWMRQKIGIYSLNYLDYPWKIPPNADRKDITEILFEHQRKALHQAKHFRSRICFNPNVDYPPIAVLRTTGIPTSSRVLRNGPKSIRGYDFDTLPKSDGDGRIATVATSPPRGVPHDVYRTELVHAFMFNDPKILNVLEEMNGYGGSREWTERPRPVTPVQKTSHHMSYWILKKLTSIDIKPPQGKPTFAYPPITTT
ncbi:hypothetical protein PROFUN_00017 [Planoprotostelium fungivorum]|uniref:Uncharacterized protein n=1 Tax=Planoprotostelium fungivorum TaxID=1890364 RepID=A0A2P6P0D3_9EUKA|nr:hypothetical protein PROFUN_00017 [Planoprotostelium fungivorum]